MSDSSTERREALCRVARRMHEAGLIAATDGNLSARLAANRFLVTPSGSRKAEVEPSELLVVDLEGLVLEGEGRPSSEWSMHRAVYEERPDAGACVHAHPPTAVALSLTRPDLLEAPIIPEIVVTLGAIPVIPYVTPTTEALGEAVRPYASRCDAFLLASHGAVAIGPDLDDAWAKLEKVEHTAEVLAKAATLGKVPRLRPIDIEALLEIRRGMSDMGPNWLIDGA